MSGNEAYLQGGSSNGQGDIEMADSDDELEEDHPDDDEDDDEDVVDDSNAVPAPGDDDEEEDAAVAKRRAIQSILRDTSLSEEERRQRIQSLMSGGRTAPAPAPAVPAGEWKKNHVYIMNEIAVLLRHAADVFMGVEFAMTSCRVTRL
eukprot:CAMPEP_0178920874 /NCGR_PEP_ID=MMETSP0786-20121207/15244_1 /TAXON_ID=186022 /ORGANISM="Thalassionema frauenfeldii, Strain CCMP 1798" /LENGTH=147 /DNA_ID=CAMNT_0020594983 /DNA_START=85 /DNA_END=529 /DNA_ORIENTATION=+